MKFSEGLEIVFSGIELKDIHGKLVPTGKPLLDPNDNTQLVVPIGTRLMAGTYHVTWHAVGVDTNRVSGSYTFKVER